MSSFFHQVIDTWGCLCKRCGRLITASVLFSQCNLHKILYSSVYTVGFFLPLSLSLHINLPPFFHHIPRQVPIFKDQVTLKKTLRFLPCDGGCYYTVFDLFQCRMVESSDDCVRNLPYSILDTKLIGHTRTLYMLTLQAPSS